MTQVHWRRFLRRARDIAGAVGSALAAPHAAAAIETTKYQGAPNREYGSRSRFETLKRWVMPARYPSSTASWMGLLPPRRCTTNATTLGYPIWTPHHDTWPGRTAAGILDG
jgi:hypothetical protein